MPTIENLRKQLAAITERTAGTDLATPKLRGILSGISKVLDGEFGKATRESRQKIKELFQAIRGEFKSETQSGPLTATTALVGKKILEGITLPADVQKQLRSRLSGFNSAGAALAGRVPQTAGATPGGQQLAVEISLNGDVFDRAVVRAQQKRDRRNPKQKRGPNV